MALVGLYACVDIARRYLWLALGRTGWGGMNLDETFIQILVE